MRMESSQDLIIPRGFRAGGREGWDQALGRAGSRPAGRRRSVRGGGDVHHQPGVCRAGEVVSRPPSRRRHPRGGDQRRQRQRGHRCRRARPTSRRTAEVAGDLLACRPDQVLVASTGVIGRQLPMDRLEAGLARSPAELSAERRELPDRRAGHPDHRHPPQDRLAAAQGRRAAVLAAGHGQGGGDDRSADGDDARLPADRCPGLAQRPSADPLRCGREQLQLRFGGGAHQHQRHGPDPLEHGRDRAGPPRRRPRRPSPAWSARPASRWPG